MAADSEISRRNAHLTTVDLNAMNHPVLQSERFERAADELSRALNGFGRHSTFEESVTRFERSIERLAKLLGMQAENDQRKATGSSMAYTEDDFFTA